MKILSLDLSTKSSGWCVGEDGVIKSHGCITASSKDVIQRIIKMRSQLSVIIQKNKIDKIVMEQVRPDFNSHTSKVLMWLQAAIAIAAHQINPKIQFQFIGPSEWRAALKFKQGRGVKRDNLKSQDIQYVKDKYGINVNDDQADAMCLLDAYSEKFDNEINWE